jgi:methylenetetrahydrofolate reductase (NADPH)
MFFENRKYFAFVAEARKMGIDIPIIPGIKPVATKGHLSLLPKTFKIDLPEDLIKEIGKAKDNARVKQIGIEWSVNQCRELLDFGVPVLHFYSMGKSDNIKKVAKELF